MWPDNCIRGLRESLINGEPKMKLDKEFIEKFRNEKIAVNVETEQEWKDFCQKSALLGANIHGLSYSHHIYKEKSCINCERDKSYKYCNIDYYKRNDYTIIKYKDLIKEEKEMFVFKKGDRVESLINEDGRTNIGDVGTIKENCNLYPIVIWDKGFESCMRNREIKLVKEKTMKLSKENSKIVKAVEEKISILENAKKKHNEKIKRIDKEIVDLNIKKDKHMVEEKMSIEKAIEIATAIKNNYTIDFNEIPEAMETLINIVKERN